MSTNETERVLPETQNTGYGFVLPKMFSLDALRSALEYKPQPDDFFVVTYPKCGTTWVQAIVSCIYREGKPFASELEFQSNCPFLEMTGSEGPTSMKRPGAIKSHLPFHLMPWSDQAKYIYVARNPKDCCVSFYYHHKNISGYNFQNGKFDDFFQLFMVGKLDFGDYFDHLLSWYNHRNYANVLFLTYEDLKKDIQSCIYQIAEFIHPKYKEMLVNDEEMLNKVIEYSSFEHMQETKNRHIAEMSKLPADVILSRPDIPHGLKMFLVGTDRKFFDAKDTIRFIRKGIIGDWKNHFSPEQSKRMDDKFRERTEGTDIPDLWKNIH